MTLSTERQSKIDDFLSAAGWDTARSEAVPGDASTRRYARLTLDGGKAILMDAPPSDSGGEYARIAKLADGEMAAFTSIATALSRRGFSAPKILAANVEQGLLLLEDLGADLVANLLKSRPDLEREIYLACMETLGAIYRSSFDDAPSALGRSWPLRAYDENALIAEVGLMTQWYLPYIGKSLTEAQGDEWNRLWLDAFSLLKTHAPGLILRDFHAENIFWIPQRQGVSRIGLIDFQDALFGHPAYDVVSLIEDARRDVDTDLKDELIERFCKSAKIADDDNFRAAYAVMGAQRNAKILGIFVRLAQRDQKAAYLDLLPRVQSHFSANLSHDALSPIARFLGALS